jgi:serine/threonine-protein kinase
VVDCLDDNVASEFVSGSLPKSSFTKVEAHLAGCRDCRMLVAALAGDSADSPDSQGPTRQHVKPAGSGSSSPSMANLAPTRAYAVGDKVGRYLVLSTLGAGGMGVVFSAYDPQLDRKVALKLLRGNLGVTTKEARARLRREAQAIAQLNHPNVVGVYDVGTTQDGDLYIAMEFVEGDTVTRWLKAWPRTWRDKLDIFVQAARGLYAAHSVGLLHRDFKPDNVLVGGDGRVRVTDFGLARSVLGLDSGDDAHNALPPLGALSAELTATGTVLGTPRYMPPEQLVGPDIDARSDQFSYCVALYEALYGVHPLAAGTAVQMLENAARAQPPPIGDVPPWVGKVVLRGLERERGKRYPTMHELMVDLAPAPVRSRARIAGMLAAAVVVLGGTTGAALKWGTPEPPPPPTDGPQNAAMVHKLEHELEEVKKSRNELEQQLEAATLDAAKLPAVVAALDAKSREVDELLKQLVELKKQLGAVPVPMTRNEQVSFAVGQQHDDIVGCFQEWAERNPGVDAKLLVKLVVDTGGKGHDASSAVLEGSQKDGVVIGSCVASAIERAPYSYVREPLDVQVTVAWTGGQLAMTTGVGHHSSLDNL